MTVKINKYEYLEKQDVKNFINYFSKLINGEIDFKHQYFHKKSNRSYTFISFYDALLKYDWNGDYIQNKKKLDGFEQDFKTAWQKNDSTLAKETAIKTLAWGGVLRSNKEIIEGYFQLNNLIENLTKYTEILTRDIISSDDLKNVPMNSGFTKIYSLLNSNIIIYDSRVGAALGMFVKMYLEQNNISILPNELNFAYGVKKGETGFSSRNPSTDKFLFDKLTNNNVLHSVNNIRANWILSSVLKKIKNKKFKDLRAIEAALFMIGYSITENGFRKKSVKDNNTIKEKAEQIPIWLMVKNAAENLPNIFKSVDLKSKILELYGEVNTTTISTYITAFSVNNKSRVHYTFNIKPRICNIEYDFLFKNDDNTFEVYDREKHGVWEIYKSDLDKLSTRKIDETVIKKNDPPIDIVEIPNVENKSINLNEIPSGLSWNRNVEFAKTFNAIQYFGNKEIALNIMYEAEESFWQTGIINQDFEIDVLRSILNVFVNIKRFDIHNSPNYRDAEFMKAIVKAVYSLKHNSMWDNYGNS
ncbi:MAG: DUF7669 domain-containing protein [Bacteroidia bacterium]